MEQLIHNDVEGEMAKADLYRAAKSAMKLFDMIKDNQDLEGWVQAKITKASDYLDSVYHYLEYQSKFGHQGGPQGLNTLDDLKGEPVLHDDEAEIDLDGIEESISYEQQLEHLLESAKKKAPVKPATKNPVAKNAGINKGGVHGDTKYNRKKDQPKVVADLDESTLSELGGKTLSSYAKKATDDAIYNTGVAQKIAGSTKSSQRSRDTMKKHNDQALKRQRGVNQALDKLATKSVNEDSVDVYQEHGYATRKDYLKGMAEEYDIPEKTVFHLAKMLGPEEDFDMLIDRLESMAEDMMESNKKLDELSASTYKKAAGALKANADNTTIKAIQAGRKNKADVESELNKKADKQYKAAEKAKAKAIGKKVAVKESAETSKEVLTESSELTRIKKLSGL